MEYRSGVWRPHYKETGYKGEQRFIVLDEIASDECPVSFITPFSAEVIKAHAEAEAAGSSLLDMFGGKDAPAWVFDAQVICKTEDRRYENERSRQMN